MLNLSLYYIDVRVEWQREEKQPNHHFSNVVQRQEKSDAFICNINDTPDQIGIDHDKSEQKEEEEEKNSKLSI